MTPAERIEAAIAARGKATPGPWERNLSSLCTWAMNKTEDVANATIIAAAPDFVDEVIRLRAEVVRLQAQQQAKASLG